MSSPDGPASGAKVSKADAAGLRLKLPATSANLGPGFDTLALALAMYLEIDAHLADEYSIEATGRDVAVCSRLEGNLLLEVYRETARRWNDREAQPLAIVMRNGIPLGMGCGSSAATRLAGVALASHFGGLALSREQILGEAARLEGHPDNAAACWLGGFVASGWDEPAPGASSGNDLDAAKLLGALIRIPAISIVPPPEWHALLVLPARSLATTLSRSVLPGQYSRRDAVLNLQRVALLTAAFATGRGDLLRGATGDCLHQPYRGAVCPLLPLLLPLAGTPGILSVTLSGAGPAVLLLLGSRQAVPAARALVETHVGASTSTGLAEMISCSLAAQPAAFEEISSSAWHQVAAALRG